MKPLVLVRVTTLPFETLSPLRAGAAAPLLDELLALEGTLAGRSRELEEALHRAAGEKAQDAERARGRLAAIALRRDVHNGRPLRPEKLEQAGPCLSPDLASAVKSHETTRRRRADLLDRYRRAFLADLMASRAVLLRETAAPLVEEGISLASRSLLSRVRALARRDPAAWGHDERHVAAKAVAYLARFCTKTSPNGLFCATALAEIGGGAPSAGGAPGIERLDVRLNIYEAGKVTACLAVDPAIERAIVPRANSTLRASDGAWTFWKFATSRNPKEDEVFCRVKDSPVLRLFIEEASRGRLHPEEIIDAVAARSGNGREELTGFYRGLVQRGILIAEIEIPYNARRPLLDLAEACRSADCAPSWLADLTGVEAAVDALPALASQDRLERMDRIGEAIERLPHTRPLNQDELFRVDAASSLRIRLPGRVLEDLRSAMRLYARIFGALYPSRNYEEVFARDFLKKHPPDADIEFLELYRGFVDPKEGERPAAFPEPKDTAPPGSDVSGPSAVMRRLRDLVTGSVRDGVPQGEVDLDEGTVRTLIGEMREPRWSAGVLFQIAARRPEDLAEGRYRLVLSSVFNGAGLALARFAWLHGGGAPLEANPIVQDLRRTWSCVEREGAVVAEITYNHRARTANAGLRPSIFRHEIEMPGDKASSSAAAIPLRDLLIRYDTASRRFVLRSASLGMEVLPVISSGVNPVGITSFMATVGYQGLQPVGYFPGFDLKGVTRWPRVVSGRTIFFRARWVFRQGEWPEAARSGAPLDDADYFLEAARWRRRHDLPRHVFVHTSEEPKPRYLDLESPLFVDLLRRAAAALAEKPPATLHVTEMYPGPEDLWIADGRGRYPSEFLVQLQGPGGSPPRVPQTPWD